MTSVHNQNWKTLKTLLSECIMFIDRSDGPQEIISPVARRTLNDF